jgi:DNA-binding LytR/AlgR family response regulator
MSAPNQSELRPALPSFLRLATYEALLPNFRQKLALWFAMNAFIGVIISFFIYSNTSTDFWKILAVVQIITHTVATFTGAAGLRVGVKLSRSHELGDLLRLLPFTSAAALVGATLAALLARLINDQIFMSLQEWFFGLLLPALCLNILLSIVAYRLTQSRPADPATRPAPPPVDSILIREKRSQYRVPLRKIVYLAAHGNQTVVHTDEQSFETPTSMKEFEAGLPRQQFQRIHRSYIVQTARIREIRYHQGGTYLVSLHDEDETQLPVGRTFVQDLKAVLDSRPRSESA